MSAALPSSKRFDSSTIVCLRCFFELFSLRGLLLLRKPPRFDGSCEGKSLLSEPSESPSESPDEPGEVLAAVRAACRAVFGVLENANGDSALRGVKALFSTPERLLPISQSP